MIKKMRLYCQHIFAFQKDVFVRRYSAYFFLCVMYTITNSEYMYAVFVHQTVKESIFLFQMDNRLESMYNHMVPGQPGRSFLHYIPYSLDGIFLDHLNFEYYKQ